MLSSTEVKQAALAVGFDDCGIARADALTDDEYPLHEWLRRGWHGDLAYMERNADKRMDPRLLVPGAKSVICLVSAYPPPDSIGGTAAYARTIIITCGIDSATIDDDVATCGLVIGTNACTFIVANGIKSA